MQERTHLRREEAVDPTQVGRRDQKRSGFIGTRLGEHRVQLREEVLAAVEAALDDASDVLSHIGIARSTTSRSMPHVATMRSMMISEGEASRAVASRG